MTVPVRTAVRVATSLPRLLLGSRPGAGRVRALGAVAGDEAAGGPGRRELGYRHRPPFRTSSWLSMAWLLPWRPVV
ncbi:hypothetical protein HS99_0010065 [Kitasatospora aureofaciens]|uniref:Uncharacterized protein n=1 Tax=Kitasatospora aureofaciens TaxID=1894 RepID=A0A1E7N284_KITAU|nr:hypothetical protein HS99_0010065 [Kitasatospora aureofaciens]